jgi:iron complex outermembrane receptor protein
LKLTHALSWKQLAAKMSLIVFITMFSLRSFAQQSATITGTVLDPKGSVVSGASVAVTSEASTQARKTTTDGQGHFSVTGLPAGKYTVQVMAPGFASAARTGLQLAPGQSQDLSLSLTIGNVSEQVNVEANASNSLAAQHAPLDALLSATSARTEISSTYIQNYTSPIADFGELTQMVPGTFTQSQNGVGLGQSTTTFRGFPDGNFDIDFDGVPFFDTNTPSHHSWAFFPSQWIGGIDFDRSPGSASTIGPTPFGGSIHLLSKDLFTNQNIRGGVSYGSFNTFLFDGQYNSGNFGGNSKNQTSSSTFTTPRPMATRPSTIRPATPAHLNISTSSLPRPFLPASVVSSGSMRTRRISPPLASSLLPTVITTFCRRQITPRPTTTRTTTTMSPPTSSTSE